MTAVELEEIGAQPTTVGEQFLYTYISTKIEKGYGSNPIQTRNLLSTWNKLSSTDTLEKYKTDKELKRRLRGIFGELSVQHALNMLMLDGYTIELTDGYTDSGYEQGKWKGTTTTHKKNDAQRGDLLVRDLETDEVALIEITTKAFKKPEEESKKVNRTGVWHIIVDFGDSYHPNDPYRFFKGSKPFDILEQYSDAISSSIQQSIEYWEQTPKKGQSGVDILDRFVSQVKQKLAESAAQIS